MSYPETLHFLYNLQRKGIRPGLSRMAALLALCNHPERAFHALHIGGTNGKGSTVALLASVLSQAGYRTGTYTSPHLLDFSERITISSQPIPKRAVICLTERLREKMARFAPWLLKEVSFFEFTTALAFLYFAQEAVDFAVVEVGMGGRFDTTNLLKPLASAITNVDFDHEQYLGSELLQIAREKAGIIKEETPLVTSAAQREVLKLLRGLAKDKHAPLSQLGKEIQVRARPRSGDFFPGGTTQIVYQGDQCYPLELPLLGRHQVRNAAVALGLVEALQRQGVSIPHDAICEGVRSVRLPGRLEVLQEDPLILLDGAHNPAGAEALGLFLKTLDPGRRGRHWLMIGMMQDKKISAVLEPLLRWADVLLLCRPEIARAADPARLAEVARQVSPSRNLKICIQDHIPEALLFAQACLSAQDSLVVAGSFYAVGEARAVLAGKSPSFIRG